MCKSLRLCAVLLHVFVRVFELVYVFVSVGVFMFVSVRLCL